MIHIFIINSVTAEGDFRQTVKEHLSKRPDLQWFVFSTSHAGMDADIARKMSRFFEGNRLRFYCCGGSGTLRNVINAIIDYPDFEVAFIPLGGTNDFLKVFDEGEDSFKKIDDLIDGRVEHIDYIKTNYGIALNTVSFGADTCLCIALEKTKSLDIFGEKIPYIIAYFKALMSHVYRRYRLSIDKEHLTDEFGEMIIGNGGTLGGFMHFSENPLVTDGVSEYVIAGSNHTGGLLNIMIMMSQKRYEEVRKRTICGRASHYEVMATDGKSIDMNLDGEIVKGGTRWVIDVVKGGLNFVLPDNVTSVK